MNKRTADLFGRDFSVGARYYSRRFALGCFQQLGVSDDVGHAETGQPRLARAKEFAWAAQLEVEFGDLETVVGAYHSIEAALPLFANLSSSHQDAIRFSAATTDTPT